VEKNSKQLRRSSERIIAGVCGGLANYLRINPWIIRLAFLVLAVIPHFTFLTLGCYLLLIVLIPPENPGVWQLWRDSAEKRSAPKNQRKIIRDGHEKDVHEKNLKD
jgi:phage shock protein PspC (stress-responsive transcriptional regulator)